jgi:hypothetical protein
MRASFLYVYSQRHFGQGKNSDIKSIIFGKTRISPYFIVKNEKARKGFRISFVAKVIYSGG